MKSLKYLADILLICFLASFLITCSGGGGDSDSSNGNSNKIMSQSLIDSDTMWAVDSGIIEIYNQNVAGKPGGSQNILGANCPLGGTVNITGTASSSSGLTTVNLTYEMTNCKIRKTATATIELTMSGTIEESGSFNSTDYTSLNFQATGLVLNGTDHRTNYDDASISETVDYSSSKTQNSSTTGQTAGTIGGRSVSWTWGDTDVPGTTPVTLTCRYPLNKIKLSLSPTRCQQLYNDCDTFDLYASSPQITSLIASGKSPCSMGSDYVGCGTPAYLWSLNFCLDLSECTKGQIIEASGLFGPAVDDPSISITDTVLYCPKTSDGKPMGACAGSIVDQCNPNATVTILIN